MEFLYFCIFYWEACGILGGQHVWHITCIYLVILLYLGISLEGELLETLLAILGGVYLFISWCFGMVKTLILPYLHGFVLLEVAHLLFQGLTTSFCIFFHGVGCLSICTCGLIACISWTTFYFWRLVMEHSPKRIILLLYLLYTLEDALCEAF
jgi:hypothetical protein